MQINVAYGVEGSITYTTLNFRRVDKGEVLSTLERNRPGAYMALGKWGEILYIGESSLLRKRLREHELKQSNLAPIVDDIEYFMYVYLQANECERRSIESILVNHYNPVFNSGDNDFTKNHHKDNMERLYDAWYYAKNTDISCGLISRKLGMSSAAVHGYRIDNRATEIKLPLGYIPTVLIAGDKSCKRKTVTQSIFNRIREDMESVPKNLELAIKYEYSEPTISRIRTLQMPKYIKWEEERLAAKDKVAVLNQ